MLPSVSPISLPNGESRTPEALINALISVVRHSFVSYLILLASKLKKTNEKQTSTAEPHSIQQVCCGIISNFDLIVIGHRLGNGAV